MVQRAALAVVVGMLTSFVGAALGLAAAEILIPILRIPAMEGQSGMFAFFVCVPIGAALGFLTGAVLFLWKQGLRAGALAVNVAVVIAALGAILWGVHAYLSPPSPTVIGRPGTAPVLHFEIRLPAGMTLDPSRQLEIDILAADRPVRARLSPNQFRQDGDRAVIVGSVELTYRDRRRNLILDWPGVAQRWFNVILPDAPRRSTEFGDWQQEQYPDANVSSPEQTFHVRYRVSVPGQA
jgi:hypothetical protein